MSRPKLSLVLCSRNDSYMGNSRWRLETALNYVARHVHGIGRDADVEILVADWGSDHPLRDALRLSPAAARLTSFIGVPSATAKALQKDSPFAEVIALNAAVRRSTGEFIGRIDQDTLVGQRFLTMIFEIIDGKRVLPTPLAMGFSNIKTINYRFAVRCPPASSVELFVRWFGARLRRENWHSTAPFYQAGVGIWLLRREVWAECGGYDERMIYMNDMETNMTRRLLPRYAMVNLGEMCDYDFYHLEHYHPWVQRLSRIYRKVNNDPQFARPDSINPNGETWGLKDYNLEVVPAVGHANADSGLSGGHPTLRFLILLVRILPVMTLDRVGLTARRQVFRVQRLWRRITKHARPGQSTQPRSS